ncbi:MAG: creatininase family protein, partial [Phycisphaeraceae bacterium]|nr:creatininase family protein [Phycisphaeraceae bacterium]
MNVRPYILAETNLKTVQHESYDVALLPWGATEAHNFHLPYGTDTIQCDRIAAESAKLAWEQGKKVLVLPTVPFGVNTQQTDIRYTINMSPTTQLAVLADAVASLEEQGIRRLVVMNGHGGNCFKQMIRQLQATSGVFLCAIDWYGCLRLEDYFEDPGDHADEVETSLMMHLVPDLVLPLSEAGDGATHPFRVEALREKWAWAPR